MKPIDLHKAGAMRRLAEQFPPPWTIPPPMDRYGLHDRELVKLFNLVPASCTDPQALLRRERERASERIEAIEDLSHYARPSFLTGQWVTNGPDGLPHGGSTWSRSGYDRAQAYHWLWWIDVLVLVYGGIP